MKLLGKMDNADIIYYLSNLLDSKSLAMFSNTNKINNNIGTNIYTKRTVEDHVLSMMCIDNIIYRYTSNTPIILLDNYEGFHKINDSPNVFKNKNMEISFDNNYIKIKHHKSLTIEDIEHINKLFNIKFNINHTTITIRVYKLDINYEYTEKQYLKQYISISNCMTFFNWNCHIELSNKLIIDSHKMEYIYGICKKLL
jgi:hypothetical protein